MPSRAAPGAQRTRLVVPEAATDGDEHRLDLLVHAMAQLPDEIALEVRSDAPLTALTSLIAAYGLEPRVRVGDECYRRSTQVVEREVRLPLDTASMAELIEALSAGHGVAATRRGPDDLLAGERILFFTNVPTHYRVALLNRLHHRLMAVGAEFRVLFTAAEPWARNWSVPEPLEFEHEFLAARKSPIGAADVPLRLGSRVRQLRPTLVVAPGLSPAVSMRARRAANATGAQYGVWCGEIPHAVTARSGMRRLQRRRLARSADFGITYGHLSAEYLRQLAPELPVVYAGNSTPIRHVKEDQSSDGSPVDVLAVARAVPGKGLEIVVEAFEHLRDLPCRLSIVGGGPEEEKLRAQAEDLANVSILGMIPSDRILDAYAKADVFVFPTRADVFGLVLVEAMGAGLAPVVSSAPGALADLALPGRNCLVVQDHEPLQWAEAIRTLVQDRELRTAMAAEARQTVLSRWTLEHSVDRWVAGFRLGVLTRA